MELRTILFAIFCVILFIAVVGASIALMAWMDSIKESLESIAQSLERISYNTQKH
jgi:hypothetical protein